MIRCYLRHSLGLSDKDILILSVGELNKNKNHEKIIKAIAKLNREEIHYAIAGKGVLQDELERLANTLGIGNRLHLLGFRKDIDLLYKAADIYAHPSIREGLSVALMEAMASGLPVVCSEIRGNTDLIESGKGGFLFEPENEVSAFSAMEQIVSSGELKLLGIFNKEKAKSLDVKVIMDKMRAIYS